jgi:chemotaxis protein MotB
MREQAAALDRQVRVERETVEARLSDIARLGQQVQALTALRDELERQAQEAAARAAEEERLRRAAEALAARSAAAAEEEARRRRAAETRAEEAARGQEAAQARLVEQTRLAESARAQLALLNRQIEALRAELARVNAALEAAESSGREKDVQIANLGARLNAALAARVEELQRYRSDFFGRLRDILGDRPEVRVVGDRFVFQSEVLFPPASAELSPAGERSVRDLARVLLDIARRIPPDIAWVLRVDGHADRNPIRSPRFASNWELSAARAIAVAQLLIQEGLPPNRVAAAAFGDTQPLDPADTPEAYARNRRIELRLTDR